MKNREGEDLCPVCGRLAPGLLDDSWCDDCVRAFFESDAPGVEINLDNLPAVPDNALTYRRYIPPEEP